MRGGPPQGDFGSVECILVELSHPSDFDLSPDRMRAVVGLNERFCGQIKSANLTRADSYHLSSIFRGKVDMQGIKRGEKQTK